MDADDQLACLLRSLESFERSIQSLLKSSLTSTGAIYFSSFFIFGVAKRAMAQSAGFRTMVQSRNAICALSLVRLQIDTAMRLNAAMLYGNSEEFCLLVMQGSRIDKLKTPEGRPMTDRLLRETLSQEYPWISEVYQQTSGFVHLSDRHIFSTIRAADENTGEIDFVIAPTDEHLPDAEFLEMVSAFSAASEIIIKKLHGWLSEQHLAFRTQRSLRPSNP